MTQQFHTITVPFMFGVTVNCYLIRDQGGLILIDTGPTGKRALIENELDRAGCKPGDLKLIALTHGDFDHCGNAAYLREKYSAKVIMHEGDSGMTERGDMFWNRKRPSIVVRLLMGLFAHLSDADRFRADLMLKEGDNLAEYGFDVEVIEIPGHSRGSIGLLAKEGSLFCGDLLANVDKPDLWSIMDEPETTHASVGRLEGMLIKAVYPGHGAPFLMQDFLKTASASISASPA